MSVQPITRTFHYGLLFKEFKRPKGLFLLTILFSTSVCINAQKIPAESTKSTLTQRLGLSDITLAYSRPNTNGRKIFGELVPFDTVWRTGADFPTFITLTDTTFIQGRKNKLAPGKYALYTIPGLKSWIIIFYRNTELWGAYGYKQEEDVLRVKVEPDTNAVFNETFHIYFSDVSDSQVYINLAWERTHIKFPIGVDINQRVLSYIKTNIAEKPDWGIYWKGARFLLYHQMDLELALEWINKSVEMQPYWTNLWTKAQIHAAMSNYKLAIESGEKALQLATDPKNLPYFPYSDIYRATIEHWKKM